MPRQVRLRSAVLCLMAASAAALLKPPHILFIVADDLGFNDASYHGSPQVPTPNLDALVARGARLEHYYVQPVCSPSRSSFLSGRHVIHTGMYMPLSPGTNIGLSTSYTLLPEYLQRCCNYSTHLVGKWHLGQNDIASIPTSRGFDTHLGYWSGDEDYYTHIPLNVKPAMDLTDARRGSNGTVSLQPAVAENNTYSTYFYTERATDIIASFGEQAQQPMFLFLAFQNVHWPLEAPAHYVAPFVNTTGGNGARELVCGMIAALDEAIGNVTRALADAGMLDDTLVIFTSDNGGPENGDEGTQSNNYPLRGGKNTLWEGGTRVLGAVAGAGVTTPGGYVNTGMMHATDWLPSLVSMASGQDWRQFTPPGEPPYTLGDGMNVWEALATGAPSPREWVLLETHPPGASARVHGDALIAGQWKLLKWNDTMPQVENGWFPPPGQDPATVNYTTDCGGAPPTTVNASQCNLDWCLFNLQEDPCEYRDVASANPSVVEQMVAQLAEFQATAVAPVAPLGCACRTVTLDGGAQAWWPCDAPLPPCQLLQR